MNISIGNDHAGPKYKKEIILFLEKKGYSVINHGTNNDQSVDYPRKYTLGSYRIILTKTHPMTSNATLF